MEEMYKVVYRWTNPFGNLSKMPEIEVIEAEELSKEQAYKLCNEKNKELSQNGLLGRYMPILQH